MSAESFFYEDPADLFYPNYVRKIRGIVRMRNLGLFFFHV